jgi:hypothetical protein
VEKGAAIHAVTRGPLHGRTKWGPLLIGMSLLGFERISICIRNESSRALIASDLIWPGGVYLRAATGQKFQELH